MAGSGLQTMTISNGAFTVHTSNAQEGQMLTHHRLRSPLSIAAILVCSTIVSGCGGGGDSGGGTPVITLGIAVTQIGPATVKVDWTDDPAASFFRVRGEGNPLADVDALTYIDRSVFAGYRYCYDVAGYDAAGVITAVSPLACITVL
jgi:hypothetical protein